MIWAVTIMPRVRAGLLYLTHPLNNQTRPARTPYPPLARRVDIVDIDGYNYNEGKEGSACKKISIFIVSQVFGRRPMPKSLRALYFRGT